MEHEQRVRRVLLLTSNCLRNAAYYRAGWLDGRSKRTTPFWTAVTNNFIDVCVLEWCKLLADRKGPHFYGSVVADVGSFEPGLYDCLRMTPDAFANYRTEVRSYRDKFIAHLDLELTMRIPRLDVIVESVSYYHANIIASDGIPALRQRFASRPREFYEACLKEALHAYSPEQAT